MHHKHHHPSPNYRNPSTSNFGPCHRIPQCFRSIHCPQRYSSLYRTECIERKLHSCEHTRALRSNMARTGQSYSYHTVGTLQHIAVCQAPRIPWPKASVATGLGYPEGHSRLRLPPSHEIACWIRPDLEAGTGRSRHSWPRTPPLRRSTTRWCSGRCHIDQTLARIHRSQLVPDQAQAQVLTPSPAPWS